jgi:hypothetical protein
MDPGFAPEPMAAGTFLGLGHWLLAEAQARAVHKALDQAKQHFQAIANGMKMSLMHKDSSVWVALHGHTLQCQ